MHSTAYARSVTSITPIPAPGNTPGKGPLVQRLFASISKRYDIANHLLSGGLDFYWRRKAAGIVQKWAPQTLLDLATGSGDLALAIQKALPTVQITGADFCLPMLQEAQRKGLKHLVQADGMNLPFADATFDALTIAFGLRNMEDWPRAISEMARVLKPGGHLLVLDFSVPRPPLRALYRFYLHRILPSVASLVTREKSAYEYLGDSIEAFPQGEAMCALLQSACLKDPKCQPLSGGIVSLYTATR
jgi:demethylmenaquinone methyltransferase / 2-methoxy-6-polyprenyl-1,4-benzoquinol methylase